MSVLAIIYVYIFLLDARTVQGFGAGEDRPILLSEVECTGAEDRLTMCSSVGIGDHLCDKEDSAGVACGKGISVIVSPITLI